MPRLTDVERWAARLASSRTVSDYDLWSAARSVENGIYEAERAGTPIAIELLYARRILRETMKRRDAAGLG